MGGPAIGGAVSVRQLPTPAVRMRYWAWLLVFTLIGLVFATLAWWYARAGTRLLFGLFLVGFANAYLGAVVTLVRLLGLWRRR
jgi:hypothetical protein